MFLEYVVQPSSTWSIVSKVIFTGRKSCTRYHWIQWWFFWFFYCLIETANSTKHTREIRDFKLPLCGRAFCDVIVMSTVVRSYLFKKLCRFIFTTEFSDFAGRISVLDIIFYTPLIIIIIFTVYLLLQGVVWFGTVW